MSDITFSTTLDEFKYNGETYLYDMEPEQDNLFMLTGFYDPTDKTASQLTIDKVWMQYQIRGVSFSGTQLSFDDNSFTGALRSHLIMGANIVKNVKIDWFEDVNRTVYSYHKSWIQRWYDEGSDSLPIGPEGKFRNMEISIFHYVNTSDSFSPILKPECVGTLSITGLIPESLGEVKTSYDSSGNDAVYSINYRVAKVEFTPAGADKK